MAPAPSPGADCGVTDEDRIDRLERTVEQLRIEVAALRAAVRPGPTAERLPDGTPTIRERAAPDAVAVATAAAWSPRSRSTGEWMADRMRAVGVGVPHDRAGLEAVVGRYGALAVGALLVLMAVGLFLKKAIEAFTLGPTARVALGAVAAALLAALGRRLRGRPASRRFGDVLLAIALAVVHVDAWGAGPYLGLLSPGVALAIAAAASVGLALLAWYERDQALFVVGVGGALVAPFVTSAGPGHPYVLPIYGWLVLTSGALAVPRRERWPFATRLLGLGGAVYAASMLGDAAAATPAGAAAGALRMLASGGTPIATRADIPALFALATAIGALVAGGPAIAGWLALAHLVTTLGAIVALALDASTGAPRLAVLATLATAVTYAALLRVPRESALPRTPLRATTTALLLPLGLLAAALVALPDATSNAGALLGGVWAALALAAVAIDARRGRTQSAGAHVAVAGLASALVPALLLRDASIARTIALAAHAALTAAVFARVRRRLALVPPVFVLVIASAGAALLLRDRPAFGYTPFLTLPSLATAAVVAGWTALAALAWRACAAEEATQGCTPTLTVGERGALIAAAVVAALLWGREELSRVGSPDVATFLLVGYFAAAGLVLIFAGRVRRIPAARQAGLALALYAAFKALVQVSTLASVGLRVASYLLVGGFLLGVGYWYRAGGSDDAG
ncbi:MAG: DUF2339 domain-containing protein [Gemmatirosa sp.]|nr:DUF2339 domain-containing protein [Gemmatirosa sp.]